MPEDTLVMAAMNVKSEYDAIWNAVRSLRWTINRTAERVAKENAAWHDDPEADDHAAYHAPAIVQFPREARDKAILDLVKHYLGEITLQGE